MKDFLEEFCAPEVFPVNLWLLLVTIAAPVTCWALGGPFGRLVFSPTFPAFFGAVILAALLWLAAVVPLYFAPLPMVSRLRKLWLVLVMGAAVYATFKFGPHMPYRLHMAFGYSPLWLEIGPALLFWGPCLGLGLPAMFEKRDEFDDEAPPERGGLLFIVRRRVVVTRYRN
jgi:hypothetical protein